MSYLDKLTVSDVAKQKIISMGLSNEDELVSTIRASEDATRSHLGSDVVDVILSVFKDHDHGKVDELPQMGLFLDKAPESKL